MKRQQIRDRVPRYLAPSTPVAHKTGEIAGVRHDVGAVFKGDSPYIISAMSKDLKDETSQASTGSKGTETIVRISETVFKAFTAS